MVNAEQAIITSQRGQQQIMQLPMNNRGLNNLANLTPGTSNNVTVDGASLGDAITRPDSGVETAATGAEVGDLFEYKIDQPVTVPRDRSALIPILMTSRASMWAFDDCRHSGGRSANLQS